MTPAQEIYTLHHIRVDEASDLHRTAGRSPLYRESDKTRYAPLVQRGLVALDLSDRPYLPGVRNTVTLGHGWAILTAAGRARLARPWTDEDDKRLIAWGYCMEDGYAFVAERDLARTGDEGRERIAWLREHKPELVARIQAGVDA